jgi:hypothetical protein
VVELTAVCFGGGVGGSAGAGAGIAVDRASARGAQGQHAEAGESADPRRHRRALELRDATECRLATWAVCWRAVLVLLPCVLFAVLAALPGAVASGFSVGFA